MLKQRRKNNFSAKKDQKKDRYGREYAKPNYSHNKFNLTGQNAMQQGPKQPRNMTNMNNVFVNINNQQAPGFPTMQGNMNFTPNLNMNMMVNKKEIPKN